MIGARLSRGVTPTSWWRSRSDRERLLLAVMAATTGGYIAVTGVAAPLGEARATALSAIARHEAGLARLAAFPETGTALPTADQPVTALTADTAPEYGLVIRRIEGDGAGARLEIDTAEFAEVVLWLEALERDHGLRPVAVEMERRPQPGIVGVRLTLER